ncbi:hypothetical protein AB0M79_30075 [Polymorphospora sp. NPDC051019]|uniref:hypothetical protein n=1 Tax=Polymorphospora sp. NPDC051019 TaxID=3155725 RepID=UPI003426F5FE
MAVSGVRRGRPIQPTSPIEDQIPGRVHRVAWLLRVNRLYGWDERLVKAEGFAKEFRGGCSRRSADRAQVSRWERGTEQANHLVIRRYEEILGVRPASLTSVADMIYREVDHGGGSQRLFRRIDPNDEHVRATTANLLDAAESGTMTGSDWDTLTTYLAVSRKRKVPWDLISRRLLLEMTISHGEEWQLRSVAISRMIADSRSELAVVQACGDLVRDIDNQVFIEPLLLLESSEHPQSASQIVRHATNPLNEHAHQGAWWAAAEKITQGHFNDRQKEALGREALALLNEDTHLPGCRVAAAELLRWMPPVGSIAATALRRAVLRDKAAASIIAGGRTMQAVASQMVIQRVACRALQRLPRDVLDSDPILERLLDEMLHHPQLSTRVMAVQMVAATPYRLPVAAALITELDRRLSCRESSTILPIIHAIGTLGGNDSRKAIERIALDVATPPDVADAAIWAIAHVDSRIGDEFWQAVRMRLQRRLNPEYALRGMAYVGGICGRGDWLDELKNDRTTPPSARTAARWWLNLPAHLKTATPCNP